MQPDNRPVREKILDAAVHLFAEYGYNAATMRDIARMAGIQAASIYYHYASKQALLVEIMDTHMQRLDAKLEHIVGKQGTVQQRLYEAIANHRHLDTTYKSDFFIVDTATPALEHEDGTYTHDHRDRCQSLRQNFL